MQIKKLSIIAMLVCAMFLLVPLVFATTVNEVEITKEIVCSTQTTGLQQKTYYNWYVEIKVTNYNNYPITNVKVSDRFGGEFGVEILIPGPQGEVELTYSGKTEKVSLFWNIGTLFEGQTATLTLNVFTDTNPGGQPEFTSPGEHLMNSGAVVKWLNDRGKQNSAVTDPIVLIVV